MVFLKRVSLAVMVALLSVGSAQAVDVMAPVEPAREPSAKTITVKKTTQTKTAKVKETHKNKASKGLSSKRKAKR